MELFNSSNSLDLTMAMPGMSSSQHLVPSSGEGSALKDLDINQAPSKAEEECMDEDDGSPNEGLPRKKLRLTKEQSCILEQSFRHNHVLNPKQKEALALQVKLKPRQVEVWFQNRRARSKLKQTEMECEYLRESFGSLTEQNRRLRREVEEVRALRAAPLAAQGHLPPPASSLSMCPRCERVTITVLDKCPSTTTGGASTISNPSLSSKLPFFRPHSAACN